MEIVSLLWPIVASPLPGEGVSPRAPSLLGFAHEGLNSPGGHNGYPELFHKTTV